MAFIDEPYRLHYIAKSFVTGLSDVKMVVYKPNGVKQGVYTLTELNQGDGKGIYFYDYVDSDMEGTYLFVVNSPSVSKKDARQVYFEKRTWLDSEKSQIRDALGINGDKIIAVGGQLQASAADLQFLRDIEGGKWEIVGEQMIFYKANNTTEVARFDLFNEAGIPSAQNVFKRERV